MAVPAKIFRVHLTPGLALAAFPGWVDDDNKVKYMLASLEARDPLELRRDPDGKMTLSVRNDGKGVFTGGGSSYAPPRPFDIDGLTKGDAAWTHAGAELTLKHCTFQRGRDRLVFDADMSLTVTTSGYIYGAITTGSSGDTFALANAATVPSNTDTASYYPLYAVSLDSTTVTIVTDFRATMCGGIYDS